MNSKIIALADCNSFFVSCEKVFNPASEGKPVVVLSGNDACVVSRSQEAKAIGIKMQAMGTEVRHFIQSHGLHIFSTNPALYRDMSRRAMHTLSTFCPTVQVYSIDEAFLDLTEFRSAELWEYGQQIRQTVKQWTGIPVSIGIAPTKTLAKIANHLAKTDPASAGVVDLTQAALEPVLREVKVGKVWGVGRQTAEKLERCGISTALDLSRADADWIRKKFSIITLRTVLELRGTACSPVQESSDPKQGMTVSRCFGRPVTELAEMKEAIATHTSSLAEKLRRDGLATQVLIISMRTNRFAPIPQYRASREIKLESPTNQTHELLPLVLRATEEIFQSGYEYYKAQVYAPVLVNTDALQSSLFTQPSEEGQRLMAAMDHINQKIGAGSIKFGAVGLEQKWKSRMAYPSKQYTTSWSDLPRVKA